MNETEAKSGILALAGMDERSPEYEEMCALMDRLVELGLMAGVRGIPM